MSVQPFAPLSLLAPLAVLAIAHLLVPAPAPAQSNWQARDGGAFETGEHWDPAGAPTADDEVRFLLDHAYPVHFNRDAQTRLARFRHGEITFTLDGHVYQTGQLHVATRRGDDARVIVTGGEIESNRAFIGNNQQAIGTLIVDQATWTDAHSISIAGMGDAQTIGRLHVRNGGRVVSSSFRSMDLALAPESAGELRIEGPASAVELHNAQPGRAGGAGHATLEVIDGGALAFRNVYQFAAEPDGRATLRIAGEASAPGEASPSASTLRGPRLILGGTIEEAGGPVEAEVRDAGRIVLTDAVTTRDNQLKLKLWDDATLRLAAGVIEVGSGTSLAGRVELRGTLRGEGTVRRLADTGTQPLEIVNAGVIAPHGASDAQAQPRTMGQLTFEDADLESSGTLRLRIGDDGADRLVLASADRTATVTGIVSVAAHESADLAAGGVFDLVIAPRIDWRGELDAAALPRSASVTVVSLADGEHAGYEALRLTLDGEPNEE